MLSLRSSVKILVLVVVRLEILGFGTFFTFAHYDRGHPDRGLNAVPNYMRRLQSEPSSVAFQRFRGDPASLIPCPLLRIS